MLFFPLLAHTQRVRYLNPNVISQSDRRTTIQFSEKVCFPARTHSYIYFRWTMRWTQQETDELVDEWTSEPLGAPLAKEEQIGLLLFLVQIDPDQNSPTRASRFSIFPTTISRDLLATKLSKCVR